MSIDEQTIAQTKQRVRDHDAKVQQAQGRRQSLLEQRERYVADLKAAGLEPEDLPARISQLSEQAGATHAELVATLDSVGA